MAVINPFVVGGYVSPRYFCDRVVETRATFLPFIKLRIKFSVSATLSQK